MRDSAYEIWDSADGNCLGMHATEADALRAVAELARQYGPRSRALRTLGMVGPADGDNKRLIAKGARLADRALAAVSDQPPSGGTR